MFAAEKGLQFDKIIPIDLPKGENRQAPYLSKNPAGQLPCLELNDGHFLAETIAICEYLEECQAEPVLIGGTPKERAETRMWVRHMEWKIIQPMLDGFRFGRGHDFFKDRMRVIPEAADGLKAVAQDGLRWLEQQLEGRLTIVPNRFTLADITLYPILEFGTSVGQPLDADLQSLTAWFEAVGSRNSTRNDWYQPKVVVE
jgi:glutathione S-transferase